MKPVFCDDATRRERVRDHELNGLDYVEVALTDDHGRELPQPLLTVYFLGKAPKQSVGPANIRIEGGRRIPGSAITAIAVQIVRNPDPELDDSMIVRVSRPGDWSQYTLRLVTAEEGQPTDRDFPGFDRRYARATFTFTAECPSDLDCRVETVCAPEPGDVPEISYLAKDYASFRQLILDRLALIMPDWTERHVPDLGITLVELLAYVGDHLSYEQDAVATEAYLDTARQRISVRRHARLVDYVMHEGCNARAWVAIDTATDATFKADELFFITGYNQALTVAGTVLLVDDLAQVPRSSYEVFEPAQAAAIHLYAAHNELHFYTWGVADCCLDRGATTATLRDSWATGTTATAQQQARALHLAPGDVLIFEEVIGPKTGNVSDADPRHRHAVRLTKVEAAVDTLYEPPVPVVEITWSAEDRLPFAFCLSTVPERPDCQPICDVTVARGNVVLVDHGQSIPNDPLGVVDPAGVPVRCLAVGEPADHVDRAKPFRVELQKSPVTFRQPIVAASPAALTLVQDPRRASPVISLTAIPAFATESGGLVPLLAMADLTDPDRTAALTHALRAPTDPRLRYLRSRLTTQTVQAIDALPPEDTPPAALIQQLVASLRTLLQTWNPIADLLGSTGDDLRFVAEVDNEQRVHLRFGDGDLGQAPGAGATFAATYRVGNGIAGNVGAEAISRVVFASVVSGAIQRVRNPLPAQGGLEPESIADVKLLAPTAIRDDRERAVTATDYADLARRDFATAVQRAAGSLRWTGSWYEAHVTVDPFGTDDERRPLIGSVAADLYRYRRIGHDLSVRPAQYVPLDIELTVCVKPHYLRGQVEGALLDAFSARRLPDGRLGFFHPDRLTFGQDIFLSGLVATAQAVAGVESVQVTRLQRRFGPVGDELGSGVLELGPEEIAQVDNDPSFPEHGRFSLVMRGGR